MPQGLSTKRNVRNAWRVAIVLFWEHQMSLAIVKVDFTAHRDQKQPHHHHLFALLVITVPWGILFPCLVQVVDIQTLRGCQTVSHAPLDIIAYLLTILKQLLVMPFLPVYLGALQDIIVHQE